MCNSVLLESAQAKVNLSLEILGKRNDGYHELRSLVVFADTADVLTAYPSQPYDLSLGGPYGEGISGDNLIETAHHYFRRKFPAFETCSFNLEKNLPVASGIGGGSADAAAVLRLLCRLSGLEAKELDEQEIARLLGADVPVCLEQKAVVMSGIGEILTPVSMPMKLHAVLVNPGVGVSTGEVFRRLNAGSVASEGGCHELAVSLGELDELLSYMVAHPNHMEAAAVELEPQIGCVLDALREVGKSLIVRMSGSGATCFALYATEEDAECAAKELAERYSGWWVRKSVFNGEAV